MNKFLILVICILSGHLAFSQLKFQELYFNYNWTETENRDDASYYSIRRGTDSGWTRVDYFIHARKMKPKMSGLYSDKETTMPHGLFHWYFYSGSMQRYGRYENGKKEGIWMNWYSSGALQDSSYYSQGHQTGICLSWYANGFPEDSLNLDNQGNGVFVSWHDDGSPSSAGRYVEFDKKHGKWQYFHKNGALSAVELYDHGNLQSVQEFDEKGNPGADTATAETKAHFPGGEKAWHKYVSANLKWPGGVEIANTDHIVVVVSATINEEGKVIDVEVSLPIHPMFDKMALQAVKDCPNWVPSKSHNRTVYDHIDEVMEFTQGFR